MLPGLSKSTITQLSAAFNFSFSGDSNMHICGTIANSEMKTTAINKNVTFGKIRILLEQVELEDI